MRKSTSSTSTATTAPTAATATSTTTSGGAPIIVLNVGGMLLRVAGLGQQFDFDVSPDTTLGELKREIEKKTSIPAPYQRLVAKRRIMDDDSMILGSATTYTAVNGNGSNNALTTANSTKGIGLEHMTKILLFHSPLYEQDREGIDKLIALSKEIDRVETDRRNHVIDNKTVQELIIQVCCKLDCVETHGSEALRKVRKATIKKAEEVAHNSEVIER